MREQKPGLVAVKERGQIGWRPILPNADKNVQLVQKMKDKECWPRKFVKYPVSAGPHIIAI